MSERRTTRKATKKTVDAPPRVVKEFTIELDDTRIIQEAVEELCNNATSYGTITKIVMEVDLNGNNVAEVTAEGQNGYLTGTVRLIERDMA